MRASLLVILATILTACGITDQLTDQGADTMDDTAGVVTVNYPRIELKWLDYADPVADANLAIGKQHFALLALADSQFSLAGIDADNTEVSSLKQHCGVMVVQGTEVTANSTQPSLRQQQLREYAARYNRQMLSACEKQQKN